MTLSLRICRRSLLANAALLILVALVIGGSVIPAVKTDAFPLATPERAVPAFWINAGLNVLAGTALVFIAMRSKGRSAPSTTVLSVVAFVCFLLGAALVDAAYAFSKHGPGLQTATMLLFICSAADILAAILVLITALLRPRQT